MQTIVLSEERYALAVKHEMGWCSKCQALRKPIPLDPITLVHCPVCHDGLFPVELALIEGRIVFEGATTADFREARERYRLKKYSRPEISSEVLEKPVARRPFYEAKPKKVSRWKPVVVESADEIFAVLEASETEPVETPEETVGRFEIQELVRWVMLSLDFRSWYVLVRRFGMYGMKEQTLAEIGESLGVQGQRVQQIESKALRILRHPKQSYRLRPCLDEE